MCYLKSPRRAPLVFWRSGCDTDTTTVCQCEQQPCRIARDAHQQNYIHTRTTTNSSPCMSTPKLRVLGTRTCLYVSQNLSRNTMDDDTTDTIGQTRQTHRHTHIHILRVVRLISTCGVGNVQHRANSSNSRTASSSSPSNSCPSAGFAVNDFHFDTESKRRAGHPCDTFKTERHFTRLCTARN